MGIISMKINILIKIKNNEYFSDLDLELVIGLVGVVGIDLEIIKNFIKERLIVFGYKIEEIRIFIDIIFMFRDIFVI